MEKAIELLQTRRADVFDMCDKDCRILVKYEEQVEGYKDRVEKYRSELAQIDKEIEVLNSFMV